PMLEEFSNLAKKLNEQTIARGHILFDAQEPYYVLDEKGMPIDVVVKEHGWSEQMIEEAMVAANVTVAHELVTHEFPGMYRIHEQPDPQKLQSVVNLARIMHCPCQIDPEHCEPIDIARFLDSIQDENAKEILSSVALRSMQKACYSPENLGHYGLALEEYCHFTSPIRRYPDLLIHRMIRRHILEKKNDEKSLNHDRYRMEKSALHLSQKERDAVTVERAVNDLEATKFMQNKVGKTFEGVISGVTSFGFFVSLDNTIEGLVPLRKMFDDFYQYDEDTMTLAGESSGKVFRLGMRVQVKVVEASVPKRQITFEYIANVF
ncbi:MAG: RNB domain-containing ribonuclease, partial [Erysipelotrichaceae bacterium]|nr:RNB domain-containing ribonuclease [Erysipelotrichaceae bacterium]